MELHDASDAERRAVFIEAAAEIGIRQDMIEKDFWVSWVLNRIFRDERLARIFLFKGGTSLSKAFNCIRRFSEDIDLLLALAEVSDPGETFDKERSRNAVNTFKSKTGKRTVAYINDILQPRLSTLLAPYCISPPRVRENFYLQRLSRLNWFRLLYLITLKLFHKFKSFFGRHCFHNPVKHISRLTKHRA